jgi:hypothetical protein
MTATLALQFIDELTVVGSGFASVADHLLPVGIHEAGRSCSFIMRHAWPVSFAVPVVQTEHFCEWRFDPQACRRALLPIFSDRLVLSYPIVGTSPLAMKNM